jgi:dolichol-phosphate mannosyltransferase
VDDRAALTTVASCDPQPTAAGERVLLCLATFNERDNVRSLVHEIRATLPGADVLIIDDHSPDGTGAVADELAAADPRVRVLHRPAKLGLGTAILAGMHHAIDNGYSLLLTMDADHSHNPRHLPALLAGMDQHDVMIGSRYVKGGGTVDWPLPRRLISRGVNYLVRLFLRIPARDTSSGYRCYRVSRLKQIPLDSLKSTGYAFLEEVLFHCRQVGSTIGETPIVFERRRSGLSKVDSREATRSIASLLRMGVEANVGPKRHAV